MPRKNPHAVALGRRGGTIGGKATTAAKVAAARENGQHGGRPSAGAIAAAAAVGKWIRPQSGEHLFARMGTADWYRELTRVIDRALRHERAARGERSRKDHSS